MRQNIRECKLLLMVLATALLSTACSSSPQPAPPSALPSVSFPAPQRELGISDNLAHLPEAVLNQRLALLQDVGVKWVRKDIEWRSAEREQGKYDWSVNDSTVATISRMGIKPLLILSYAPQWAAGEGQTDCANMRCSPADTPAAIDAFGAFARAAVKHYCVAPYNVHTIEIWNEPNLHKYWPNPNPATYVKVLKAANQAIKSSGCDVQILMGGLGDTQCTGCLSSSDFLTGVYANGGKNLFDAVGNHPYIAGPPNPQNWQPLVLHNIMEKNGDGHKQVWATEFAYSSRLVGTEEQARYMQEAIQTFRTYPWAGPLFWFTLQDMPSNNDFGLIDSSGKAKPALDKLRELAHS